MRRFLLPFTKLTIFIGAEVCVIISNSQKNISSGMQLKRLATPVSAKNKQTNKKHISKAPNRKWKR